MTTRTGSTTMRDDLETTLTPPPFLGALFGGLFQIAVVLYLWHQHTSARDCLEDVVACVVEYRKSDLFGLMVVAVLAAALLVWFLSVYLAFAHRLSNSDPSIVDRLWSTEPILFVWIMYFFGRKEDHGAINYRLLIMALIVTLWGGRLTWNFWIKGGFSGGEDHRWKEVRRWFPGWKFEVFNFIFISFFQQMVIFSFITPAVIAMQATSANSTSLNIIDYVAIGLCSLFLLGETIADWQMYQFQTEKYRLIKANGGKNDKNVKEPYASGFIQSGLWSYSRHPNYFCEVSLWWAFYLFSVAASFDASTGGFVWLNWTLNGAIFLTLLFVPPKGSVDLTEYLSSKKYPNYKQYQGKVPRFLPFLPVTAPHSPSSSDSKKSN